MTIEAWQSIPPNDEFFARFPEWKERQEEIYRLRHNDAEDASEEATLASFDNRRKLQASNVEPTQLLSAQFIEIDTSSDMAIINQDDSYLNLAFPYNQEGITLSYTSISATLDPSLSLEDQLDSVPGGAILVLIGQDEKGEVVRNRLMWTYTMGCGVGVQTIRDGDEFGWAVFVSVDLYNPLLLWKVLLLHVLIIIFTTCRMTWNQPERNSAQPAHSLHLHRRMGSRWISIPWITIDY